MKLHLGCGLDAKEGYINIDKIGSYGVDLVLDVGKEEFPYDDSSIDEVVATHFIEHLDGEEVVHLMDELYRICKNDAIILFTAPYFTSPTSCRPFHKQMISETYFADFEVLDPNKCKSLDHRFYFHINAFKELDDEENLIVIFKLRVVK